MSAQVLSIDEFSSAGAEPCAGPFSSTVHGLAFCLHRLRLRHNQRAAVVGTLVEVGVEVAAEVAIEVVVAAILAWKTAASQSPHRSPRVSALKLALLRDR